MSKHAKVINEATLLGCFLRNATHLSNYGKKKNSWQWMRHIFPSYDRSNSYNTSFLVMAGANQALERRRHVRAWYCILVHNAIFHLRFLCLGKNWGFLHCRQNVPASNVHAASNGLMFLKNRLFETFANLLWNYFWWKFTTSTDILSLLWVLCPILLGNWESGTALRW